MKHIIYSALILLLASACNKPVSSPEEEQYAKYIFFSQQVETKASLVESAEVMGEFGVVGFKYEGEWNDVKASSEPKVFYDDNGNIETPETLTCNGDGTADYAPLQGWSSFKKYAFFAYYPIGHDALSLVNLDGKDYTAGVPAIKYTMDQSDLMGSMVDVMTAPAQTDLYWKSSADNNSNGGEVTFSFAHRLSSLGVKVKNSSSGDIVLNSVSLNISGIKYQSIVIPLDGLEVTKTAFASAHASEMALAEVAETSLAANEGESELADKLIFIPQDEDLTATVTIGYTRNAVTGTDGSYEEYTATKTLPVQKTKLDEGKKHLILLNFTDSTVEIIGVADTGWVDVPEVEDTFN